MEKDSCYGISFNHNYYVLDSIHDGGTVLMLTDFDENPAKQLDSLSIIGATDSIADAMDSLTGKAHGRIGWFNTRYVLSLQPNSRNSGWTGISNGWQPAYHQLKFMDSTQYVTFMFSFGSDADNTSDGWGIDDVCINRINPGLCYPVGLSENRIDRSQLYLGQNIPNPATNQTSIPYYIPKSGEVNFIITNMVGQTVQTYSLSQPSGNHMLELDLSNMSKGIYYYTMNFEDNRITNKMVVVK